jgi:hypothetical protein
MRTTVDLDDDARRAVDELRREQGYGLSAAVNELIRRGLHAKPNHERFAPRTRKVGVRIDASNVVDALEVLEGPQAR